MIAPIIKLEINLLRLERGESSEPSWHIITPCKGLNAEYVYTVAIIEWKEEERICDLRTIGTRPWELEGTSVSAFMEFASIAMCLINQVMYKQS